MHNKFRGEVNIKFAARDIILRPSFQALAEIETVTGKSVIEILVNFEQKQLLISEIMAIIKSGYKAYSGEILSELQLEKMIAERGLVNILPDLVRFLQSAVGL